MMGSPSGKKQTWVESMGGGECVSGPPTLVGKSHQIGKEKEGGRCTAILVDSEFVADASY